MATLQSSGEARERILAAAYELFSRRGIRAVGVDEIVAEAGVARMTLYRHFGSKDELVLAFLARREQQWTDGWLRHEVEARASEPEERLLAIFDVFDGWFREAGFEGCSFINVMLEIADLDDASRIASVAYLANIRGFLEGLARGVGVADPAAFARQWHILMKGSIVAAGEGDHEAARRAQAIGRLLLADARAG
jgi:AcrR family transcriptional regulator